MSTETKQWICFVLFRILLPFVQLGAAVIRFNGFSLLYGCLALINPLLRRPTCYSMTYHTGRYLTTSLVLCAMTMLAQIAFQLFCVIAPVTHYDMRWLFNLVACQVKWIVDRGRSDHGSKLESALRQIGLQQVQSADTLNAVRIILPDVGVFAVVLVGYICCHVLLRQTNAESADTSGATVPLARDSHSPMILDRDRRRLFKYGVMVADFAGNFAIVMTLGAVGIALPSVINSVYFVLFIIVVTLWSCSVKLGRWFSLLRVGILVFVAVHLVAIHLSQFEFSQRFWQARGNGTVVERILGLPRFVEVDCVRPWVVSFKADILWTAYLDTCLLIFFYFILAFEIRRRMEPMSMAPIPSLVHIPEEYVNPAAAAHENEAPVSAIPHPMSETQGLMTDVASPVRNYHSLDAIHDEPGRSEALDLSVPQTTVADQRLCEREPNTDETPSRGVAPMLFQFIANQSYIGTLIIMMAWSVVYHSWLAFVLLIAACLIWIVPQKRNLCLRCSPVIVIYAICLLVIQYVYGFNLNDHELPEFVDGYHLKEIGLVKYKYPVGPLAVQISFTLVFWLTLRQFTWELSSRRRSRHLEAESLETLNGNDDNGPKRRHRETLGAKALKKFGRWLFGMMCKYWIFLCAALFLFIALQKPSIYRIIYMVFFLLFVIVFQLSYTLWRYCIKAFWWIVILYSMFVLVSIYVFQFEDILTRFQNSTGMSDDMVADLGIEVYETSKLLVELLTPTSFLIFIILHLHYFQNTFLQISDVERYQTGSAYNLHRNVDDDDDNDVSQVRVTRRLHQHRSAT